MTPEQLKVVFAKRFQAAGLLHGLDLEESKFSERPRFFEVSHLAVELSVTDPSLVAAVSSLADQVKSDLFVGHGVELDVLIRTKTLAT